MKRVMATRKICVSSSVLIIFLLIIPNNVVMARSTYSGDQNCIQESFSYNRLVARDVIQQTIHDIKKLEKFINDIPRLKSFRKSTGQSPELKDCVEGLVGHIMVARKTLSRIRRLNDETMPHILSNSKLLQNVMNEAVKVQGRVCHIGLKDVDRTITSMLSRKLLNVAVTIDDIVYLVYQLQSPETAFAVANP